MEGFKTETHSKEIETIYKEQLQEIDDAVFENADLAYQLKTYLRFLRKTLSSFIKRKLQKDFKEILYITTEELPIDYILAFQKQYPDKRFKVLIPIDSVEGLQKTRINFEYYLQNRTNTATIYKFPENRDNIKIYGIYSSAFSGNDLTRLQYLAPFVKAVRICAKKIKPDIIHAHNIPFFMGAEFESKLPYPIKVFQSVKDFSEIESNKTEAFWSAINLGDKSAMKRICRDKVIKKCIARLFNLHNAKRFYPMRECLDFIYQNYFKFRKYIDKCEDIEENILFNRMNLRILKLFPQIAYEDEMFYNSMFYTLKKADFWGVVSETYYKEIFEKPELSGKIFKRINKTKDKSAHVSFGYNPENKRTYEKFTIENFRELRSKNKGYLLKEFSLERIKTKFIDSSLFQSEEYIIRGYLDSFYNAPLLFGKYTTDIFLEGVDIAFNSILKLFELNKNVQVIINIPNGLKNNYISSWVEFLEKNPAFNGRWLYIDSEINLSQFCASSDLILLPKRGNFTSSDYLTAMKYGCVPVASRSGILNDTIADIFDDITNGCGFKTKTSLFTNNNSVEIYLATLHKALNLYTQNPSSWNLLIKNGMNYNFGWDFKIIEGYNQIYDNL